MLCVEKPEQISLKLQKLYFKIQKTIKVLCNHITLVQVSQQYINDPFIFKLTLGTKIILLIIKEMY